MKPVLIFQSHPDVPPGTFMDYFGERRQPYRLLKTFESWSEPDLSACSAAIYLGTPLPANQYSSHESLQRIHRAITQAYEADLPCLGICGSSQLMAMVLGSEVRRNEVIEAGVCRVTITESGATDPLLNGCETKLEVFQWHNDTFDLPDPAVLLVSSDDCHNQVFRKGPMIGMQFHPEADRDIVRLWCDKFGSDLEQVNLTASEVIERFDLAANKIKARNFRLLDNFLREI